MVEKVKRYIGTFTEEIQAARVYDMALIVNRGHLRRKLKLNFDYTHAERKMIEEENKYCYIKK